MKLKLLLFFMGIIQVNIYSQNDNYPKPTENTIRLMTYNVSYARGNTGNTAFQPAKVNTIGRVIKLLDPDIVSLQELDSACAERYHRYLLKDIKEATGEDYTMIYTPTALYNTGNIGNGVLVKSKYSVLGVKPMTVPGNGRAMTRINLENMVFFSTHWDVSCVECRQQSATLLNAELRFIRKPVFLAGDLNDSHRWRGGAFPILEDNDWELHSTTDPTEPSGTSTIDYILFHDYNNSKINFLGSNPAKMLFLSSGNIDLAGVSDHYPVYLDIEFPVSASLDANYKEESPIIYPSVTTGLLHVNSDVQVSKMNIYTNNGQLVQEISGKNQIDISSLQNGTYYVEVVTPELKICQAIIKQ